MQRSHKIGIFVLFGSGFICIVFATLRVIQLGIDGRGRTTTPEPKWMLLWTVLECSMGTQDLRLIFHDLQLTRHIAIIIGCSPAFAVLIRKRLNDSKKRSYGANGYPKHATNEDVKLKNMVSSKVRPKRDNMDAYWDDNNSSQEELAKNAGQSATRATMHHDDDSRAGSIAKM
jgi:hypothetical protein